MNTAPRNLPRFLPTLSEVVHPSALTVAQRSVVSESEILSQTVLQQVELTLESRLFAETKAMVNSVVAEQMQILRANLRQELEVLVQRAVVDALNSKPGAY